jgi:3-methyladenine DNA glycosylase AlkC
MPQKGDSSNDSAFKHWINANLVKRISTHVRHHYPDFDSKKFESLSLKLEPLELKARTRLIAQTLQAELPQDYLKALKVVLAAAKDPKAKVAGLSGFDLWPFTEFIQLHGLKNAKESLEALMELTQLFTAEFAVRPFLIHHQELSLKYLDKLATHPVHHVRRWVSEGSRPRLPWGERLAFLVKDPTPSLKLLEKLKYDQEIYVRKSVANHLNDITKDNPAMVIKTLQRWNKEAPEKHQAKITWITKHSLRGLIKKGHPDALKLIGVNTKMDFKLRDFKLDKKAIKAGDKIHFNFEVQSKQKGLVVIDYVVHYRKARGEAGKIFKLSNKNLKAGEWLHIEKKHSFKPVTTRVLYPGVHHIEILANGKSLGKLPFTLKL